MAPSRRLDSWKEIADYLRRDVRTAIRWEKEKGLPVHRIPGGSRHSVFAFANEIDDWMSGQDRELAHEVQAAVRLQPREHHGDGEPHGSLRTETLKTGIDTLEEDYGATSTSVSASPLSTSEAPFPGPLPFRFPRSRVAYLVVWAFAFCVGALLVGFTIRKIRAPNNPGPPIRSVAVLPLQNLSGDSSQDYLADGITEALITDLAQIHALRVISRTSIVGYKGTTKKLPEIARELSVDAVVEGSVARSGNEVRVTAQLVEAPSDTHLWAQTYQANARDLLDLQTRVARAIVQQVGVTLTPQERRRFNTVYLVNPEAHETYLLGRYYWNQRTPEAMLKSLELYEKAIRIDPTSAEAYGAMASAYITLFASDQFLPPRELEAKARAAAEKAISLDDTLAEPHAALAVAKAAEDYDWKGSDEEFQRAFELDPNYASAYHWYGYMLMYRGRVEEAYAEVQKGYRLDPLNPALMNAVTAVLEVSGKYQEALQQARKQLELDPHSYYAHWAMGDIYTCMGKYDDAVATYRSTLAITPGNPGIVARLCYALGMERHSTEALQRWHEVEQSHKGKYVSHTLGSWVYAGVGDRPRALQELEQAYQERSIGVLMLKDPHFDSLRSEPRFQEIAKRAGLD
jgi:TolB-like protein/Flp pilus assembly protein TadD